VESVPFYMQGLVWFREVVFLVRVKGVPQGKDHDLGVGFTEGMRLKLNLFLEVKRK